MAEIDFALARVRELRWVDQTNLFLMGHGEGGDYAARYHGPEFRGQVASGAVCARGQGRQSPLLVIVAKDDAVLKGTPTKCRGVDGFEAIAGSTH